MAWDSGDKDLEKLFIDELEPSREAAMPGAAGASSAAEPSWDDVPAVGDDDTAAPASLGGVPLRQQRAAAAAAARGRPARVGGGAAAAGMRYEGSTVDETDWASLAREGSAIARNLKLVCNPLINEAEVEAMLQHWDMWGPLIFTLLLATLLSLESSNREVEFCVVVVVVIAGGLLLTANVILLGGSVSFFQSVSLLGYCMFPLDLAALFAFFVSNPIARAAVIAAALLWAMRASVPFVGGSVGDQRRLLAVFPLALMYAVLGWLTFIS